MNTIKKLDKRTEYERKNDLVSREVLVKNVAGLTEDLTGEDFHAFYHLLWAMSINRMLQRMAKAEREREEASK